jgi:predicted nucleic acid-binding protein
MKSPELFVDSSARFAGVGTASGASRALLVLAEEGLVTIVVSEQGIVETERAVARKVPRALPALREALRHTRLRIVRDPRPDEVQAHRHLGAHQPDVAIVLAAMQAGVDYLVTPNRRHFIDDPRVPARSGLRVGTPGTALGWARARWLAKADWQRRAEMIAKTILDRDPKVC